jgi:hypothetical protein
MCYTCGCKLPFEDHGDPANIIEAHLVAAGATDAIDDEGVASAKENMLELIRLQKEAGELDSPRQQY